MTRYTCAADHPEPLAVTIPRSFNPSAIAAKDVAPALRSSAITGARSRARCTLVAVRTCALALLPFRAIPAQFPLSPPSTTPLRLAAASAAFVRALMAASLGFGNRR